MSWSLIRDQEDLRKYRVETEREFDLISQTVDWIGVGPASYPALVTSTVIDRDGSRRLISCYVLLDDARKLMAAGGATEPHKTTTNDVAEFCKYVSANILTMIYEMKAVGVITQERYEKSFIRFLQLVDQAHAENRDIIQGISPGELFKAASDGD